ncbi:phosphotransferase-like protein [Burkholderia ubonensis]|uniref:phosphotransferase-like protein n=1 Tax=Burkholderia ubonensis TaxID=101571 RepID=UPI00195F470F|nr:hypothetical protein [Burkholderia ubonensis]
MTRNSNNEATIVLLNGVGSVGKSALARELQAVTTDVFLHVQMDAFLAMLPGQYMDHPEGFMFSSSVEGERRVVSIQSGPVGARVMQGMRHAIAALASQGNNLIVDEVLLGQEKEDYVLAFRF